MPRPSLSNDIAAPPTTASTSLSTSQGALFDLAGIDAEECSSRRAGIRTSLATATDARCMMRRNPMVTPLQGPTTEQLSTAACKSLSSPLTLHTRGPWAHTHGDTTGASTPREASSIKSGRSTGRRGGRSAYPEAPHARGQVSEMQSTSSVTSLRTTSPPARPSTAAGVWASKTMDPKLLRIPRSSHKATEVSALRTRRQRPCAQTSTSSPTATSSPALCGRQSMISSMAPYVRHQPQHRQRQRLSSLESTASSPTAQNASAVKEHEAKASAASARARVTLTTATAAPSSDTSCPPGASSCEVTEGSRGEIASGSEAFTAIASVTADAGKKDWQSACGEDHSWSTAQHGDAGRGDSTRKRHPAAPENSPAAALAPTNHQVPLLHECPASTNGTLTALSSPPASPAKLPGGPLPVDISSRCCRRCYSAREHADEDRVVSTRAGDANGTRPPPSPLAPIALCAFTLPDYQHHSQAQQASRPDSEKGSSPHWPENRCSSSAVEQALVNATKGMQECCVVRQQTSPPPAFLATVARASSSGVTGQLPAEDVDADAAAGAGWVDPAIGTSPPVPLHTSFASFAQSSASVSPLSASAAPRLASAPRSMAGSTVSNVPDRSRASAQVKPWFPTALEWQVRPAAAAALTPSLVDDEYGVGTRVEHAEPHIPSTKFLSIDPPRAGDPPPHGSASPFFSWNGDITARGTRSPVFAYVPPFLKSRADSERPFTSLELESYGSTAICAAAVAAETEVGVSQTASTASPKPASAVPATAAPATASVSPLSHTPAVMLTMSFLGFSSRSPTPVLNSCTTPLQQRSARPTSNIYDDMENGGSVIGGVGNNITTSTAPSPLPERSQLRTSPHQPAHMSTTQTSRVGCRADSWKCMSISCSCGGGGVPPQQQSVPFLVTSAARKNGGPGPLNSSPNTNTSASTARTTDSIVHCTGNAPTSGREIEGGVFHAQRQRSATTLALLGIGSEQCERPDSLFPSVWHSGQYSGSVDATEGDSPEGVAGTVGRQQQQQPRACRLTAFQGMVVDSPTQVSLHSVTADSDAAIQQETSVSPPPNRRRLKNHGGDIFPTTTATTAARPLMTALSPMLWPRPHQRTNSSVSLLSSIALSRLGGCNGSDTTMSTPPPLPTAIASPGVAPALGTFSTSSTFTGFGAAPSCIFASGLRSASISCRAHVSSLSASPPLRHRSVGSASSLSSMGAFAFSDANAVLLMHNGVLSRVAECVQPATAGNTPRNGVGGRVVGGAEQDADDMVHGDKGENYLEDRGTGACKASHGRSDKHGGATFSGCGGGVDCSGKLVRLKPGTAIEAAIQAGAYARHPSCASCCACDGGGGANAGVGKAEVTSTAATAAQVGSDGCWSGSEDRVTWLSCAASFTASSTSASMTYVSSSFGSIPRDNENVTHCSSQQQQQQQHSSRCDASADAKESKDGFAACTLYAAAPWHYHYHRTVDAPTSSSSGAVFHRRGEKRHHRYVRVHHSRRPHRSLSNPPATSTDVVEGKEQAHSQSLLPAFTVDAGICASRGRQSAANALPDTPDPRSPRLSTSSLLYYDDVSSDGVDDLYYQIEKRLLPIANEAERSRCRASRASPPPQAAAAAAASVSPTGDTKESPHEDPNKSYIDALFTVLDVPPHLQLRGGFHLSDYYVPCPVCHPAMRVAAEATVSGLGTTAGSCSCSACGCCCSSVRSCSTGQFTLSSRAMSQMSGGASPGSMQLTLPEAAAKASASRLVMDLRPTAPLPPHPGPAALAAQQPGVSSAVTAKHLHGVVAAKSSSDPVNFFSLQNGDVAKTCDARRQDRQAAAARRAGGNRATAAGEPVPSAFTTRSSSPYAGGTTNRPMQPSRSMQGFSPALATARVSKSAPAPAPAASRNVEDKVRDPREGRRGTCGNFDSDPLPPPSVVTATHRNSRYRRQRTRHPPAAVVARRGKRYDRGGGGVGDGALHSQYSRFMQQRLLCVRVNDRITYIDPKTATGAARLLAGAALLAEKTKKKEAERERRHRATAGDGGGSSAAAIVASRDAPAETSTALPASPPLQHATGYPQHSRCRNGHHHRHQCCHTHSEHRRRARDQRPKPVERQRPSETCSHDEA
ncbi:hypothetical protein, unknown function [Leishmania tarentolae]|uniref:Uncharacterized protein n=1 Tax=Leishmania tarentolae TaxID=5689 RepID=A0A640KBI1_LEITA|nr:hypothetical protein, unknown function [Leishmania tarentolae]